MAYLVPANFTEKTVNSSMMLQPGGGVGSGSYVRTRKNTITSPTLIRRFGEVSSAMKAACSLADHCTGNAKLVGKTAPDGKPYRACGIDERRQRLLDAQACATRTLPGI